MKSPYKIVLTGVESSGKSTLAQALASELDAHLIPEYAREYLLSRSGYTQNDLTQIAKGQLQMINEPTTKQLKICDTDLQVIKIWSQVKYNTVDDFIIHEYQNSFPDLYILCVADFPWQHDPLRENQNNQQEIHQLYVNELKQVGVPYIEVNGDLENRKKAVLTYIKNNFM